MTVTTSVVATPPAKQTTPIKRVEPDGTFAGIPYFEIPSDVFQRRLSGKIKSQHWKKFLVDTEVSDKIKAYIKRTKNRNFLLKRQGADEYINVKGWM